MPLGNCHVENWADSGVADNNSQQTDDTSTDIDIDTDDKHQVSYLSISQTCLLFTDYITDTNNTITQFTF